MAQGSSSQVPASALQPPAMPRRPEPPAPRVGVELAAAVGTGTMSEAELQRLERQTVVLYGYLWSRRTFSKNVKNENLSNVNGESYTSIPAITAAGESSATTAAVRQLASKHTVPAAGCRFQYR